MSTERQQIEATIVGLEAQRALLGDAMVDAALVALRGKLDALKAVGDAPAQVLKQATILFLDIVGSTTLGQKLDPEAASTVLDGALAQFTGIVAHHGGKVLKYAGDSVLAVFGATEAREDDPERAVRAGLALLAAGQELGELVRRQHGYDDFNVRVGVHTGGVLLGGGVDAQDNIRGQAVNIAARMEQTAPPGGLRISHDTYRPRARRVHRRAAGAARREGDGRADRHLPCALCEAAGVSRGDARHRRGRDADDRARCGARPVCSRRFLRVCGEARRWR
jgi:class 3 adenylate cyclase